MTKGVNTIPIAIAILIYNIWNASNMFGAWISLSPFDLYGWLAFILWLLPLIYLWCFSLDYFFPEFQTATFLFIALLLSTVGMMASLNVFAHIALVFAFAAFMKWNWGIFVWMVGALSWIPAFGYLLSGLNVYTVILIRVSIAILSAILGIYIIQKRKN